MMQDVLVGTISPWLPVYQSQRWGCTCTVQRWSYLREMRKKVSDVIRISCVKGPTYYWVECYLYSSPDLIWLSWHRIGCTTRYACHSTGQELHFHQYRSATLIIYDFLCLASRRCPLPFRCIRNIGKLQSSCSAWPLCLERHHLLLRLLLLDLVR